MPPGAREARSCETPLHTAHRPVRMWESPHALRGTVILREKPAVRAAGSRGSLQEAVVEEGRDDKMAQEVSMPALKPDNLS